MRWSNKPAGCWHTALLILLALALLGCGLADAVQRVAEPIDESGCQSDCKRAGMEFARYIYETHACWCSGIDGSEVKLYGLLEPGK